MGYRRFHPLGFIAPALGVIALLCATSLAFAVDGKPLRGVALIVGNGAYEHLAPLTNPPDDARAVEDLFDDLGFETSSVRDADARKLRRAVERFIEDAEGADAAVVYYAGHGIEAGGENWLIPTDVDLASLDDAGETLVPLSKLMRDLGKVAPLTIVLLDACRDNPFPPGTTIRTAPDAEPQAVSAAGLGDTRSVARFNAKEPGEVQPRDSVGALIGFAAEPGKVALDGDPGANSPYAAAVLRHVSAMTGEEFGTVMRMVAEEVYLKTGGRQRPWVNESLRRLLYFGASPAPLQGEEGEILQERRQLLLTIAALPDPERRAIERASRGGRVPMDAVYAMLRALGAAAPADPAELEILLRDQAAAIRKLREERATLGNEDPELRRLVDLADRATAEGALHAAIGFHERAKARVRDLAVTIDKAEAEMRARRLEFASIHAGSAEAYLSTFDYARAAADFAEAFRQAERWDDVLAWRYKNEEALALAELAERSGGTDALFAAIRAGDVAVETARRFPSPEQWVTSLQNLGNAMVAMSRIDGDPRWLEDAGGLYRTALDHTSADVDPLRWAWLQSSVGNIYLTLGERDIGQKRLEQAVDAYRSAVDAAPRARFPYEWALFQNNLGNALFRLGGRQPGTATLEAAVTAYRAALEEFDPGARAAKWILTLNNLGKALHALGERDNGVARLDEAIAVQRRVLAAQDRAAAPLQWASTQNDLGNALMTLGTRTGDIHAFEQALEAFRNTASEWRRDVVPVQWGMAMVSLGNAYLLLGRERGDGDLLKHAIDSYRQALQVRSRDATPAEWIMTRHNLATALASLGGLEPGTARLEEAVDIYRSLLEVRTRAVDPLEWAGTQHNLGKALRTLGERQRSASLLRDAVAAFRLTLGEFTRERTPHRWASSQAELGETLLLLAELGSDSADLAASVDATRAALSGYDRSRGVGEWARAYEYLARATHTLGMRGADVALLAESAASWRQVLDRRSRDADPMILSRSEGSLGLVLLDLGTRTGDGAAIAEGRDALADARQGYAAAGVTGYGPFLDSRIARADTLLGFVPQ